MPPHYFFARGPHVRELINPGYTIASYSKKRWLEATTAASVGLNLLLPMLQEFNAHMDLQLKQIEKTGVEDEDIKAQMKESVPVALTKAAEFVARTVMQTAIVNVVISWQNPFALSLVHGFDSYQRVHHEYYSRLLRTLRLSTNLAGLFGMPPKGNDVAFFETRPLSVTAAAEDAFKRHVIFFVTDMTVGAIFEVIRSQNPKLTSITVRKAKEALAEATGETRVAPEKAKSVLVNHWASTTIRYACIIAGAALGSRFAWRNSEYVGELAGSIAALVVNNARINAAKKALAVHSGAAENAARRSPPAHAAQVA